MKDSKQAARKFKEYWTLSNESEVGGYQKYWLSLLGDVLGMDNPMERIQFQVPVPMAGTTKFLDAWIPETKVLIEHKKRGVKLDAPQSGHDGKTPYEQALEYNIARGYSDKARWIVTSNFDEIWVYDMDKPLSEPQKLRLSDLPREAARLDFLADNAIKSVRDKEKDISVRAGRIVGEIYDALLKRYGENRDEIPQEALASLNRLCVRLVFCFYAEDAEIFPKDSFWKLLKSTPASFLRSRLAELFKVLDTKREDRSKFIEPELDAFDYTNGGLFAGAAEDDIPPLDEEVKELLVKSANFDWRDISPTIFGALFESTLNPVTRRAGGMVYTSVENIHKVIDPLFLNDLKAELEKIKGERSNSKRCSAAADFQNKLASLTFLDPACGSGNFLTETFLSLRELENEAIKLSEKLREGERIFDMGDTVKVKIDQFHGIEINDFAVSVAKTAMWISEAKMLEKTAEILAVEPKFLPLHDYNGIIEGNALRLDWPKTDYIMGNPPFVGASMMSPEQKGEAVAIFGKGKRVNSIDYVGAWYYKAAALMSKSKTRAAFVSTNSITQGEQVAAFWGKLFADYGLVIDFAWRTFVWNSESFEKAHVHCVIVGFHVDAELGFNGAHIAKTIFDEHKSKPASHINAYLMDAPDVFASPRPKPICAVPPMTYGNKPSDGGNLILCKEDRVAILNTTPSLAPYIRRYVGAQDFINNDKVRYCLWLRDVSPATYRSNTEVMRRLAAVREMRLASSAAPTRAMANAPYLFFSSPQTESDYLLVPEVSSERREYVPMGFLTSSTIAANTVSIIPNATPYHFGILTSSTHMAWMRVVAGRLKSDYRYSAAIVYNNFPWPEPGESAPHREKIEQTAQGILDVRAKYPESSLADLYDPLTMPSDLRAAHIANDKAVLAAYGLKPVTPEPEIVAHLFKLYAAKVKEKGEA